MVIYKVFKEEEFLELEKKRISYGSLADEMDGFIHLSTKNQLLETLKKHFHGQTDLQLLQIDVTNLNIVWEVSRGDQLFPHLYDALPLSAVVRAWDLHLDQNNKHLFPEIE